MTARAKRAHDHAGRPLEAGFAAEVLAGAGVYVLERSPDGLLRAVGDLPAFLAHLFPGGPDGPADLAQSPFLENFLVDAEAFWARGEAGRVRSGPWLEPDGRGLDQALEASAVRAGARELLLVEHVQASFAERVALLQQARDQGLELQKLTKHVRALSERAEGLSQSVARLEGTLANAPASLLTVVPDGRIALASGEGLEAFGPNPRGRNAFEVFEAHPEALENLHMALRGMTILTEESFLGRTFEVRYTPIKGGGTLRFAYDVTEREATEQIVLAAKDEAERASHAKTEFIAHMSHELRTPLTSVIGFSEVLYYQMAGPLNDVQREYLAHIQRSGEHLLSLIDDLLEISRIEQGALELRFESLSVAQIVEAGMRFVRNRAERGRLKVTARVPPRLHVLGDARKLRQVILNLLSNAVKFTPEGGRVSVRARAVSRDELEISVADTGIGISEEAQRRLFQPFSRLAAEEFDGTGLGLVITKRLVETHGGTILVSSAPGEGSTFTVRLPRARAGSRSRTQ